MKKLLTILVCLIIFTSCSDNKEFKLNNNEVLHVEPYGWMTPDNKVEGVTYKVNKGDIVLSIIFSKTLVAPILITGLDMFEPICYTPKDSLK